MAVNSRSASASACGQRRGGASLLPCSRTKTVVSPRESSNSVHTSFSSYSSGTVAVSVSVSSSEANRAARSSIRTVCGWAP